MTDQTCRTYLTLRCNLACWHCSNGTDIRWSKSDELSADQWLRRIAELPCDDIVFTGGEPTLHAGFLDIVTKCPKYMNVYSNFVRPLPDFPKGLRIHWRASCHAQTVIAAGDWIANVTAMRERGYKMTLTTVYAPKSVGDILKEHGIHVDERQFHPVPIGGKVSCRLPRNLIAPDGKRYHCVSKLVRRDPSGLVALGGSDTIICEDATRCVPCDSIASERKSA